MEREHIIKALECCSGIAKCIDCPYAEIEDCAKQNTKDTIALIKELTEENERLSAYNENLIKENTYLSNHLLDEVEQAKDIAIADTLSELKNRLTREVGTYLSISIMKVSDMFKLIDQIAKEMIENG